MKAWIATLLFPWLGLVASHTGAQELPPPTDSPKRVIVEFRRVAEKPSPSDNQPASTGLVQEKTLPAGAGVQQPGTSPEPFVIFETGRPGCSYPAGRVWGYSEALFWWTRGNYLPPLVTGNPQGTPRSDAAVLGKPSTSVIFGDQRVDGDMRVGGRFTLGFWLNDERTLGFEGNYFLLETRATHFGLASAGDPIFGRPFFDVNSGVHTSVKTGFAGLVRGSLGYATSSSLQGAEAYFRQVLRCDTDRRLDFIAGYRWVQLNEDLHMRDIEIGTNPTNPLFDIPIDIKEAFHTTNSFHGGQVGLIGEIQRGRWYVRGVAKVAIGCTTRTARITGSTQVEGSDIENGGLIALPSNIGSYRSSVFSVVPETGVFLGYNVTERMRVFGGYSFLYWTNLARTGDQVDLRVNTSQFPLAGGIVGPALPEFSFRSSNFWAQGISFGLEFRY